MRRQSRSSALRLVDLFVGGILAVSGHHYTKAPFQCNRLLVAQALDGIEARGFAGGPHSKDETHTNGYS